MAKGQMVSEFRQCMARVLRGVGLRHAVVEMNFHFSITCMAMFGEHLEQAFVVLLGGIEVGVDERASIMVTPAVDRFRIFAAPGFQAAFLLCSRNALRSIAGNDRGFEMIGHRDDEMRMSSRRSANRPPRGARQDLARIHEFFLETH